MRRLVIAAVALAAACSDALEQDTAAGQLMAVVNSGAGTLSLVSATQLTASTLDLQAPAGGPATIAGLNTVLAVPLPNADTVAFVDFARNPAAVYRRVPLARGAGAAGVAIVDDSIAWVANPGHDRATRINYRTGDTASVPVGPDPQAVVVTRGVLYVVNANLAGGSPAGPSSITWRGLGGPAVSFGTIALTGADAEFATVGTDSLIYVVDRGAAGAADGQLSIVDPVTKRELVVVNGLGDLPGPPVFHPSGRLLVASDREGILEVNTATRSVVRGPGAGVKPGGDGIAALAVDQRGRIYALARKDCVQPGVVHVLTAPPDYREIKGVPVGVCPSAAAPAFAPTLP